ncbi:MAG: hypothetical protein QOF68_154 [Gaiellales bacterium]|nr:hypothetical protein [Gaiellales bacterium]
MAEGLSMRTRRILGLSAAVLAAGLSAGATTPHAAPLGAAPGCPVFPQTNVWNADISALPPAANSNALLTTIGLSTGIHPDFGSYAGYGIPFNVVTSARPKVKVRFDYAGESDKGPYPIPAKPKIEGGSDRHMLIVDRSTCTLYELFAARKTATGWRAGSGAIWSMSSNALRPDTWTSADAAGLPILPGLVRYKEVSDGLIDHALRFTTPVTRKAHIYPARHDAGAGNGAALPPMGIRVRLRADFDLSRLGSQARVIAIAMQTYGMILADNGSAWYVSGASEPRFNDDDLRTLNRIKGSDFEVVDTSGLVNGP